MYELFFYMLSLFCRTRNPHLVIPKFSCSSIFCLTCFENPASSTRAAPCYPEIWTCARTPSSSEIAPLAQTCEIPLLPLSQNEAPRRGVKTGGGTLVTYPTFRTSASLSLAPPSPPHSYPGAAKPRETPCSSVGLPTAAQPKTLP